MHKNKAFTLVELLAVIVILGLIALITVPTVLNKLKSTNEDLYKTQIKLIKAGAASYVADIVAHPNINPTISNIIVNGIAVDTKISLNDLQLAGAVEINVLNPLCDGDDKYFSPTQTEIILKYDGKEFSYEIDEKSLRTSCSAKRIDDAE